MTLHVTGAAAVEAKPVTGEVDVGARGARDLGQLLSTRARETPQLLSHRFVERGYEDQSLTYGELYAEALGVAQALLSTISAEPSRAILLYPPGLGFIAAFFGCQLAGVSPIAGSLALTPAGAMRIKTMFRHGKAHAVLTTSTYLQRLRRLVGEPLASAVPHWLATDEVATGGSATRAAPAHAFIQFSSGSTGEPKPIAISQTNVLRNLDLLSGAMSLGPDDRSVSWLPHAHDLGLVGGVLEPIYCGHPGVLMPPIDFLRDPRRWLELISRTKATLSGGPNFAYEHCLLQIPPEERTRFDLSAWAVAYCGAEPVWPATVQRFVSGFSSAGFRADSFYPSYGLAEATLFVSGGRRGGRARVLEVADQTTTGHDARRGARRVVSCGPPQTEVTIVDPNTRRRVAPSEIGEIWVRGESVAEGYLDNPEASQTTFGALVSGEESRGRHLRTGDLGFLCDGELFVSGRLKDLLIVRGRNVHPEDIEETAQGSHPLLHGGAAAAFAVGANGGEEVVLVQEIPGGERRLDVDVAEALVGSIRSAARLKQELELMSVVLVQAGGIPRTTSGKIRRSVCRDALFDNALPTVHVWDRNDWNGRSSSAPIETN